MPVEWIRKQIEGAYHNSREGLHSVTSISNECKRALAYAAEEAERLSHKHMVLSICFGSAERRKVLCRRDPAERGLRLSTIREELARTAEKAQPQRQRESLLSEFSRLDPERHGQPA
jgi:ATP-dependent Clp protease ATP-binding subunit ClpC